MSWRYFLAWLPGIPIAILNGSIRQFVFSAYMNELAAHQLSVVTFLLLFGLYVWFVIPWLKLSNIKQAWLCGIIWLVLTIIFEFVFGHWVMGHSWEKLLHDYNLFAGRLWIIVLLWISISPRFIYQLRYQTGQKNTLSL